MKPFAICRLLLPALLVASAAAAQDPPPRDPLDDTTVRLGPIGLTPMLLLRDIGRDNNVFNEATDPKSDFTATITPKLDVLMHPGPMLLTVTTSTDYVYYQKYKSEGGTNVGSSARADFTLGRIRPYVSAGGGNSKGRLNREIDARARHWDRSFGSGVRVQILEGLFASVDARQSTTRFEDDATFRGENLANSMNEKIQAIDGSMSVALTPLTTVSVAVTTQRDRFDLSPGRDSDTLRIMPTVTFSPLAMLNGTASLGYRRFTPLDPDVPGYRGFVAALSLGTTLSERHRLETTFGRDVQYSYEEASVYYVETGVSGLWTWHLVGPVDLRFSGSRSRLHYQGSALPDSRDDDTTFTYGAGVAWRARQNLKFGVDADWRERASERGADRGFDNRKIAASVTWGKQ